MDKTSHLMRVDLLVVGEQYAEDGSDRASVTSRALEFLVQGIGWHDAGLRRGRANLSPGRISDLVRAGCFVVLVDRHIDEQQTPKIHAALAGLAANIEAKGCYVLPIAERQSYGSVSVPDLDFDGAVVAFLEHYAGRMAKELLLCG